VVAEAEEAAEAAPEGASPELEVAVAKAVVAAALEAAKSKIGLF